MVNVAIDGPSGAGKSTLSRRAAKELGFLYVDTGAMYRAVGLFVLQAGQNPKSEEVVQKLLPQIDVSLKYIDEAQRVFLNGQDVSCEIRKEEVGMAASAVSAFGGVRAFLLESQRRLARQNNVIMDGRDIGTVVLPNADVKIFLTATAQDRAMRRYLELVEKKQEANYEKVLEDVQKRDYDDTNREKAPLKQAQDAILLNTTGNSFEESLDILLNTIKGLLNNKER